MKNLDQIKCKFSYSFVYLFDHYLFDNVGVILQDPTAKFKCTLADWSFAATALNIWNGLPDYIRKENDFDTHLKLKCNITPKKKCKIFASPGSLFFSVYYYTFYNSVI